MFSSQKEEEEDGFSIICCFSAEQGFWVVPSFTFGDALRCWLLHHQRPKHRANVPLCPPDVLGFCLAPTDADHGRDHQQLPQAPCRRRHGGGVCRGLPVRPLPGPGCRGPQEQLTTPTRRGCRRRGPQHARSPARQPPQRAPPRALPGTV